MRKMWSLAAASILVAGMLSAAGCGARDQGENNVRQNVYDAQNIGIEQQDRMNDGVVDIGIGDQRGAINAEKLDGNRDNGAANLGVGNRAGNGRLEGGTMGDDATGAGNENQSEVIVSDRSSARIVQLPGVKRANVIVINGDAYAAVSLIGGGNAVPSKLEQQIDQEIRALETSVKNVYVTTNPRFSQMTRDYIRFIDGGKPVDGFVHRIRDMASSLFPNDATANDTIVNDTTE
ncbi:YhcN/YlaJ family sporulation lipoprotein [Paenibacillus turpanensis]|uniref:YhcN/YlaJ family sporulation lipoprotein n=1 Tax=Paenibacillus turpanensis TaxID=2689078 RepID=UPI00140E5A9C|nr:YhcN/YlaJ family sporulation lipoprotein [Paenibacillus turpanensis]